MTDLTNRGQQDTSRIYQDKAHCIGTRGLLKTAVSQYAPQAQHNSTHPIQDHISGHHLRHISM
jgi:hypothetical protein